MLLLQMLPEKMQRENMPFNFNNGSIIWSALLSVNFPINPGIVSSF